jgi:periplasmic copper chaperone A
MARRTFMAGAMALALLSCSAPDQRSADIAVSNGWTREIAPGQSAGAVYLTVANKGEGSDRLVNVKTTLGDASLHMTSSADGVARMRPLDDGIEIPPRSTVELKPGGTHIMVTGIQRRPPAGQSIELTLGFERSGKRPVMVRVIAAGGDGHLGMST